MGFIDFLRSFFEESEEELLEDIKEAEKLKKEAEKRLKELKKKNKSRKKLKPMPTKYKVLLTITIVVIVALCYGGYKYMTSFHFKCEGQNPCKSCGAVILCPQFDETDQSEHYLHFILENRKNTDGDCSAIVSTKKEGFVLNNKTVSLGIVPANQQKRFKMPLLLPGGESTVTIGPDCEW